MHRIVVVALTVALGLVPLAARAEPADHAVRLFATVTEIEPLDESTARLDGQVGKVAAQRGTGWEAGLEWRMSALVGAELSVARSSHDLEYRGQSLGAVRFDPILLALNFHLLRAESLDVWVAPTAILLRWTSDGLRRGIEIEETRKLQIGATVGADWSLNETWAITGAVRYVDSQLRFGGGSQVAVDPLTLRLGLAARI